MPYTSEWKSCSICKKPISYEQTHFVCSVSTCNGKRTGYKFCSVPCFDQHIPKERHKSAGAIEEKAPTEEEARLQPQPRGQRRIIQSQKLSTPSNKQISKGGESMVIASRVKAFIQEQSELSTSTAVIDALSDHIRHVAMQAIDKAKEDGRKTVMEQDVSFLDRLNLNI